MLAGQPSSPTVMRNRDVCAAALVKEAGGEGRLGMELVWQVIWERMNDKRWPSSPARVVLQPKQFSCYNGVKVGDVISEAQKHSRWRDALGIVSAPPVYRPATHVRGCNHYHATTIRSPYWAKGVTPTLTYKNHRFYQLP